MAEPKFEKDLEKLEQIVEALEAGGLSLDESLKRFEEGVKLARRCEKALAEAERKIEILVKNAAGEIVAEPFEEEPASENENATSSEQPARERKVGDAKKENELLF
jgi:exodeoxyribonuclease VII small subunit